MGVRLSRARDPEARRWLRRRHGGAPRAPAGSCEGRPPGHTAHRHGRRGHRPTSRNGRGRSRLPHGALRRRVGRGGPPRPRRGHGVSIRGGPAPPPGDAAMAGGGTAPRRSRCVRERRDPIPYRMQCSLWCYAVCTCILGFITGVGGWRLCRSPWPMSGPETKRGTHTCGEGFISGSAEIFAPPPLPYERDWAFHVDGMGT